MNNETTIESEQTMTETTAQTTTKDSASPFDEISEQVGNDETARDAAMAVPMTVQVVVGKAQMTVKDVMNIRRGAVVELDRKAGDVVDIVVNGTTLAHGELTVFEDGRIGVTLVEIVRGKV